MTHLIHAYANPSLTLVKGEGAWVIDDQGDRYLDAFGGVAVNCLGHAHPAVSQAIAEQATTLSHCSNIFYNDQQLKLAKKLCQLAQMDRVFFCNSGAEANECALKLSRLHAHKRSIKNPLVISFDNSFHGRTLGTLAATGNPLVKNGFEPLLGEFLHLPFNDLDALSAAFENHDNIVAVMVEAVQGEAGIIKAEPSFLHHIRQLCSAKQALMICDEIQSGMGRTGNWFAYQGFDIIPDIVTVAKALGNGFPIGACLSRAEAAELIQPGNHGSTFGGNPLACCAGLTVIDVIEKQNLLPQNIKTANKLYAALMQAIGDQVVEIRYSGLMFGIGFTDDPSPILEAAQKHGLLLVKAANNTLRLLPSYLLSDQEITLLVERLKAAVESTKGDKA